MEKHETKTASDFWDAMEDVSEGMLGLADGPLIPMTPKVRDDTKDGTIWFITASGTDLYQAVQAGAKPARLVVADRGEGLWADITGTLAAVTDQKVLDDVWSVMVGLFFGTGKDDPDVRLLAFKPQSAEATISDNNAAGFFYNIAKAKITGEPPEDMGWQGTITF